MERRLFPPRVRILLWSTSRKTWGTTSASPEPTPVPTGAASLALVMLPINSTSSHRGVRKPLDLPGEMVPPLSDKQRGKLPEVAGASSTDSGKKRVGGVKFEVRIPPTPARYAISKQEVSAAIL